jgi:hypothetical protein
MATTTTTGHHGHCNLCSAPFTAPRSDARFCSPPCRAEAELLRRILTGDGRATQYTSLADRQGAASGAPNAAISRMLGRAARAFDERERERRARVSTAQRQLNVLGPRQR